MENQITGLDAKIREMAARIRELREIEQLTVREMAKKTGVSEAEYLACEQGESDLNFAFIYRCAQAFNVDVTDIIEGTSPRLAAYTVTRRGEGQRIEQAHGMVYYNLASAFRNRIAEPLFVRAAYTADNESSEIEVTTHDGQECDIVISGTLCVQVGDHKVLLKEGDSIYYDSSTPHGMKAVGGRDCTFYAMVLNPSGEPVPELETAKAAVVDKPRRTATAASSEARVYDKWVNAEEDENGVLKKISFNNPETFNFAYDIVDELARTKPDKLAMLHLDKNQVERRFTFQDIKRASAQCANYFKSLGIKKGDRVMLVLKRHYQFWFAMIGLNKLGAIVIPATNQLKSHDFSYRFSAAGVSTLICTSDNETVMEAEEALREAPSVVNRIIVGESREGWRNFDDEYKLYSTHFDRTEETACGDDLMLMFFTSGTTGYPKIAAHNYKYALGHFLTAKYWHGVNPEGLHFTISDTGWAKAMWGKLYGQWMAEGATFVYDFDRFSAADILPLFAKYHITTFCAPPTMYRMMIKQDISKYDMTSVERATTAGEALNPEVFRQLEKLMGVKIMEGFGQSEGTLMIGNLRGDAHKLGSMGKPVPLYDVDIVDADGKSVGIGETGEIVVHTENGAPCGLFTGYYLDEEKTREAWHDGLYHTGDTAWRDEEVPKIISTLPRK